MPATAREVLEMGFFHVNRNDAVELYLSNFVASILIGSF
jgi:hypothetical protein